MCSKEMWLWVLPLGPVLAALCRWSWQRLGSAAWRESEMAEGRQDSSSQAQAELCGRGTELAPWGTGIATGTGEARQPWAGCGGHSP